MLHWRAESLAALGIVVLIVDLFGDATGAGWDPEWSNAKRAAFREDPSLFQRRMELSLATLAASPIVDASRTGAFGYCFGGPAVLALLRANPQGLLAGATFHGILNSNPPPAGVSEMKPRLLICHADEDPFVSPEAFAECTAQLRSLRAQWSALVFGGGVVHSFTNPAQALNLAPQFGFDERAATESWAAAKTLLAETLLAD